MNIYIPFAIISILLLHYYKNNKKKVDSLFFLIMLLAFFGAAIRYEFGPDYFNYHSLYDDLRQYGVASHIFYEGHAEPVFAFYLMLFPKFTLFIALNSFFWFGLYYLFFKEYTDSRYLWLVVLLVFFNINCILNNLVAMRTAMCSFLFIPAFYALKRGQSIFYILIVLLCTALHTSSLLLLPLVFIRNKKSDFLFSSKYLRVVIILAIVLIIVGRYTFIQSASMFIAANVEEFQRYSSYLRSFNDDQMSIVAIIKYVLLLALSIIPLAFIIQGGKKESNNDWQLIYKLGIVISTVGILLGQGLASRYMLILNPFYFAAIVRTLSKIVNPKMNMLVIFSVVFTSMYSFYFYLQEDYCVSFLKYHSIFSAPSIP